MSQVYSTEPQTSGRVILETTHGPLEIHLWCRECPATTKLFLQLCLDGFYDNVVFHRMVPNFLIQTGALRHDDDPSSGTKKSPSTTSSCRPALDLTKKKNNNTTTTDPIHSYLHERLHVNEALSRRSYEVNSRIRFNHRGQVVMALGVQDGGGGGTSSSNSTYDESIWLMQPQFFITMDEAPELDGKHVCFGTIRGPTVFNALRIGRTDVDASNEYQPTLLGEAPRIVRAKIVENPIHTDLVPSFNNSLIKPWDRPNSNDPSSKTSTKDNNNKKKRKAIKNVHVLSFGDEVTEDLVPTKKETGGGGGGGDSKIKSSHDMVESKRLTETVDKIVKESVEPTTPSEKDKPMVDHKTIEGRKSSDQQEDPPSLLGPKAKGTELSKSLDNHSKTKNDHESALRTHDAENTSRPGATPVASGGVPAPPPPKTSLVEARRAKYLKKKVVQDKRQREQETLAKFMSFQTKVSLSVPKPTKTTGSSSRSSGHVNDSVDQEEPGEEPAKQTQTQTQTQPLQSAKNQEVYHGQVLEDTNDATTSAVQSSSDWMKARFTCRQHPDHEAQFGGAAVGADGRNAFEDYEVVDEKWGHGSHRSKRHKSHRHEGDNNRKPKHKGEYSNSSRSNIKE